MEIGDESWEKLTAEVKSTVSDYLWCVKRTGVNSGDEMDAVGDNTPGMWILGGMAK